MGKIHLLPEHLVNQIAAGEVVERPASVVKELCENALDAGAASIRVELIEGGLRRIAVADDGCGMSPEDALLCLDRHATSKLQGQEGLSRIATMGFRGEAVPAIASVSRLTLTTREASAPCGTRLTVEGGKLGPVEEAGAPPGTSVIVEDLFFNTPARRKFLKRAETEAGHASEVVVRLALARPDVAFSLASGGRKTLTAPASPGDPRERIAAALGSEVFDHLVPVDFARGGIRVRGHVASPDFTLSSARGLYTFVNGRFVRDRGLIAAVQRAFADATAPGRQPAAVLFVELALEQVDVNVHPQKLEVRFADSRAVFEGVFAAVQDALRRSPWLTARRAAAPLPETSAETPAAYGISAAGPRPAPLPFAWGSRAAGGALPPPPPAAPEPVAPGQGDERPPRGFFHSLRVIGQFARTYLVCEGPGPELVVIDQHAAHERLKFHELREAYRSRKAVGQAFLFPAAVELPLARARVLADHLPEVRALGFELEPFGGTTFALKSAPAALLGSDYRVLLDDLAGELMQVERGRALEQAMDHMLATMACHAAVRAHQALAPEEARALLDALDAIDFNSRCPHGRPVAARFAVEALEREVARR
jgi:DNA mismatch repair protein MutL